MRKITVVCLGLVLATSWNLRSAGAQEEHKPAAETTGAKVVHAYRVDFSINELQDGKKTNTRHYSMILTSGDRNQVKIGTRVPVSTAQTGFQYLDVGTNISCRIVDGSGEDLMLEVHADFSNLSSPEEQHSAQPIIRQVTLSGTTVTTPGKSVIIGAADDPNSDRQFQLEATVTKLR
jgi:hypothetical protein